ncbi:4-HYDROXY-2-OXOGLUTARATE ALDOLASE, MITOCHONDRIAL-RELATED [Ceraceosorus bombacis]|uniref:4-HYDROXY-2-OXOGLUTARATE ALDOLASE, MITOCHONDRIAL-RELATED n=1 Tax=Ceraceosorus bombacis TaxID=401625 RepID=A0A0P1BH27_9BASI|nr:4-HYDROXY-2-OXOGLUTARATE ALDOLASE, MITOCHONDRIAL-RELATED [Ceraceosorus bombacis]
MTYQSQPLPGGVYVPLVTPFTPSPEEDLDLEAFKKVALRVASAGCGLVVLGTGGEASHVTASERIKLVSAAREFTKDAGLQTPIIAGTGTGSLYETKQLCKDAAAAGADAAIVLTPGFFAGAIAKDRTALKEYFHDIASASPIPVMVYNFPAVTAGIDLDSDLLEAIAEHPNIVGAKLTCGSIGKGARLASSAAAKSHKNFHVFPGLGDMLLPSMLVGMTGTIAGSGNIFPRLLVQTYKSAQEAVQSPSKQTLSKAQELQALVSRADWAFMKGGIGGTKWVLRRYYDDVGEARRPLQPATQAVQDMLEKELRDALDWERKAEREAGVQVARE